MKKKKWSTTTTTTKYDRIQALMRNPNYLHDLEAYNRNILDEESICKKYNLRTVIYPEWISEHLNGNLIDKIEELESLQLFADWIVQVKINKDMFKKRLPGSRKKSLLDYNLRDGKYLTVEIDLTKKKEDIMALMGIEIDIYQAHIGKTKNRDSKTTIDPWKVYNMHNDQNMNFSQIAQKISGIKGSPSYDAKISACYKQVKRAYEKAEKLIAESTPK